MGRIDVKYIAALRTLDERLESAPKKSRCVKRYIHEMLKRARPLLRFCNNNVTCISESNCIFHPIQM